MALVESNLAKGIDDYALEGMNLHDEINIGQIHILRVQRGWIYYYIRSPGKFDNAVFVPQTTD